MLYLKNNSYNNDIADIFIESYELRTFLSLYPKTTYETAELILRQCKTIDEFLKKISCWSSKFNMDKEQFTFYVSINEFYKNVRIDLECFQIYSNAFNVENNFKNFYNYINEKDYFQVAQIKMVISQLIFYQYNLKIGDLIQIVESESPSQSLAIYIGKRQILRFHKFDKYFQKFALLKVLSDYHSSNEKLDYIKINNDNKISLELFENNWFKLNTNIYDSYKKHMKSNENHQFKDLLDILTNNLKVIKTLNDGDIIRIEGTRLLEKYTLYNHAALVTNINKFEIIHKDGEPTGLRLQSKSTVKKDHIIEKFLTRFIHKYNFYDDKCAPR
jgi:hypothetical protein